MHPDLANHVKANNPKINTLLTEGLARVHMKEMLQYLEDVNHSAARGWTIPITYKGMRHCDPIEMYKASLKTRSKKRKVTNAPGIKNAGDKTYDMARTDFFLVEFIYEYKGKEIRKPIWLPDIGQAGSLYISGTKWFLSPVLADKIISVGIDQIFVRLLRDRPTFSRMGVYFKHNGITTRTDLVHSKIYHTSKDKDKQPSNNAVTSMPHYLFCKLGFAGAMEKYLGITPLVGYNLNTSLDASQFDIFTSNEIEPSMRRGRKRNTMWCKPDIQVALRKEDVNPHSLRYIAALFYVADYFPRLITPDTANLPDGWIAPMGYMLFSENQNRGNIEKAIRKHLISVDGYADTIVIENMRSVGLNITDIYDFFAVVSIKFSFWISNNQDKINSLYNKEMSVLPFVMFDVVKGIFNNFFALESNAHKDLSVDEVSDIMKKHLKPGMCYALSKSHGEVQSISYSGDNMAFKATATLTPQTATSKATKKGNDRGTANDPAFRMHPSIAEVAASTAMSKGDPVGISKLNHFLQLDAHNRKIARHEKYRVMQDKIARNELTTRPIEQDDIIID